MAIDLAFKECAAMLKARRTRKAIAKLYKSNPAKAIDHVNAKLDEASRAEYERMPVTL